MITAFMSWLGRLFRWDVEPISNQPHTMNEQIVPVLPSRADELYELAKSLRGRHLTLDESVPRVVGCAQAVSKVLQLFGTPGIPQKGISGTDAIGDFLDRCTSFSKGGEPGAGKIILFRTGKSNGKIRGHIFIGGQRSLMSNNSETGLWSDHWQLDEAKRYYGVYGAIPMEVYTPL